jgi:hypothetical protein
MIKKIWNKIFRKKNKRESNINFIITESGGLDIDAGWYLGQEEDYAKLIYAINSGVLLKNIISHLELISKTFDCEHSYKLITEHLNNLYNEELKILEELRKNSENETMISPSDVFSNTKNKEDEDEDLL